MKVYKNKLTGEIYAAESKVRAWLYFYRKGKNSAGRNMPSLEDVEEL